MTDNGWVKLWRRSIKTGLIRNHKLWVFWTYCLMKANHEKNFKCVIGDKEVILQPGQFVTGRKIAAKETALSEQNVRTCIAFLKKYENLTIKSTNRFSVITIVNWDTYQGNNTETNQVSNTQVTSNQPAGNHIQEQKNKRTKEKKLYTSNFLKFWNIYPRKTGKGGAFRAYKNIQQPKPTLKQILKSLKIHKDTEQWQDKQFIPNPSTWLNQRRWEDEPDSEESFDEIRKRLALEKEDE